MPYKFQYNDILFILVYHKYLSVHSAVYKNMIAYKYVLKSYLNNSW